MQTLRALALIPFVFAGLVLLPLADKPRQQAQEINVWPAALKNVLANDKDCGHAARLLVREAGREIALWDAAGRRQLMTLPLEEDGSASLEAFSAVLGARLAVIIPAGTGPREFKVQKKWPVVCMYEVTPQ